MSPHLYIDFELAVAICQSEGFVIRDAGLLGSALTRPMMTVMGDDAYPSVALKAAALLHSITCIHCLVDRNKRLGWLLATVFLDMNGYRPDLDHEAAYHLVMRVAEGSSRGVADIADELRVVER